MRHTLKQELGLDAAATEALLKKLTVTGRLVYVGSAEGGPLPVPDSTGPVISMPLTQSADGGAPLITAVSPKLVMGVVENQEEGVSDIADADTGEEADLESSQGYWRIG
jgi:hypothetical protein